VLAPSLWTEPLGLVAYEAYEMAKPVLASSLGGLKEVVQDRQTGRLLEPGNVVPWRETIQGLNAAEAQTLGQTGRRWLEANASAEAWNRGFDAILHDALPPSR
jgi:glycosyltransferase involved in cell wall biosynthesis